MRTPEQTDADVKRINYIREVEEAGRSGAYAAMIRKAENVFSGVVPGSVRVQRREEYSTGART